MKIIICGFWGTCCKIQVSLFHHIFFIIIVNNLNLSGIVCFAKFYNIYVSFKYSWISKEIIKSCFLFEVFEVRPPVTSIFKVLFFSKLEGGGLEQFCSKWAHFIKIGSLENNIKSLLLIFNSYGPTNTTPKK